MYYLVNKEGRTPSMKVVEGPVADYLKAKHPDTTVNAINRWDDGKERRFIYYRLVPVTFPTAIKDLLAMMDADQQKTVHYSKQHDKTITYRKRLAKLLPNNKPLSAKYIARLYNLYQMQKTLVAYKNQLYIVDTLTYAFIYQHPNHPIDPRLAEVYEFVAARKRISAVKVLRGMLGCGLYEAKNMVEGLEKVYAVRGELR